MVDPLPFLAELARRGVKAAVFEGAAARLSDPVGVRATAWRLPARRSRQSLASPIAVA